MKQFSFLLCFFITFSSFAQQNQCGYDRQVELQQQQDPEGYDLYMQAHRNVLEAMPALAATRSTSPTETCAEGIRIIPIYMHILYDGGSATVAGNNNFTVAEIQKAITQLNVHFQGSHASLSKVQNQFWADERVSANTCIQFCWNTEDINRVDVSIAPNNITVFHSSGIVHSTIRENKDMDVSPLQNRCQYVNIYVGRYGVDITGGGELGYAMGLPFGNGGIRIDDNIFVPGGPITNPIDNLGITNTHEMGHYLGLSHIWAAANIDSTAMANMITSSAVFCSLDDGIADTPNQGRPSSGVGPGVPTYFQNEVITQCGNTIMWTNFMDYSNSAWMVNFTKGQVDYMHEYLAQFDNPIPFQSGCDLTGGFLNGETRCGVEALDCAPAPILVAYDTIRICGTDTINLNQYIEDWGFNTTARATTEYSWRKGSLSGGIVDFAAKTIIYGNSPVCTPDTIEFYLNMKCTNNEIEAFGGKVIVLSYLTPEQLLAKYLKDGDCENGPGSVFSVADSAANCHNFLTFIAQSNPTFPTTVSGEIEYDVTFSPQVLGPCCTLSCNTTETAQYRCEFSTFECTGIAVGGGFMTVLSPCPDFDFDDAFTGYENNLVSLFDPNGFVNDFYYFSDPERTIAFDPTTDFVYDGNGCTFGSSITIYTSLGCDTDLNGVPNGYVNLGTVTLSGPMPFPSAPTVEYSLNGDMDCVYEAIPNCWDDDITPSIPIEICGASGLSTITFSVLSGGGCVMEHTVAKPDCPDCASADVCGSTTYTGGFESVCSNNYLANGLPQIELTEATGSLSGVFWANGPIEEPWTQLFQSQPADQPNWSGPMLFSDAASGLPETQVFFAYSLCDDDSDPETLPIYIPLGDYEVTIEPIPDGRVTPVCIGEDSLNFYIEVELFSNAQSNTFTATNSYNSNVLNFSNVGMQLFGPYLNGSDVSVDFAIDGGCALQSETFNTACLSTSCVIPEIIYSDTCLLNPANGEIEYWIETTITGSTVGYLFNVTNNVSDDTTYMNMFNPVAAIGPFPAPQTVEVVVADYTNGFCFTSENVVMDMCLLTGISEQETRIFSLYPNPATETINIKLENGNASQMHIVSVYDAIGKEVLHKQGLIGAGGMEFSLSALSSGVYAVRISTVNKQRVEVLQFVKE